MRKKAGKVTPARGPLAPVAGFGVSVVRLGGRCDKLRMFMGLTDPPDIDAGPVGLRNVDAGPAAPSDIDAGLVALRSIGTLRT